MSCQSCGGETLTVPVTQPLREYLPGTPPAVAICQSCLAIDPVESAPESMPDLTKLDDAMPSNSEAAVPLVLLIGLLDSLAIHRDEITALLAQVERAGTDPLLAVDRLADSYGDDAHTNLASRRRQLEQLI